MTDKAKATKHRATTILLILFCAVFALSAVVLALNYGQGAQEEAELQKLAKIVADGSVQQQPSSAADTPAETEPAQPSQKPAMLERYQRLYQMNRDMAGWIRIDGTTINYPVMYTPEDGDFYLSHGFDKEKARGGVPFIDERCSVEPFGTNTIIYGHHMKTGTMFAGLERYRDAGFFQEHPIIRFDTLYEQREYEIIAAFESRVYQAGDKAFKHYNFISAENRSEFDQYIANIRALALYDTGNTASYGDTLLTLITCDYHTDNGQFVVVARKCAPTAGGAGR